MSTHKRCPSCGAVSTIQTPACATCGHQFRTQFLQAPPVVSGTPPPRPAATRQSRLLWWLAGASLSAVAALAILGACLKAARIATLPPTSAYSGKVRTGMTEQEVLDRLGQPQQIEYGRGAVLFLYWTQEGVYGVNLYRGTVNDLGPEREDTVARDDYVYDDAKPLPHLDPDEERATHRMIEEASRGVIR